MVKGQAMVEFLTTYGWAILALLLVVGALLASGLLTPNFLTAEECTFGTNILCNFALYNEGPATKVGMELTNGFPYKIKITEIQLTTSDGTDVTGLPSNTELESGATMPITGLLATQLPEGGSEKFTGNITYVSCAPELGEGCLGSPHILSGRITGKVIKS